MRPALEAWRRPIVVRPEVRAFFGNAVPAVASVDTVWVTDFGERLIVRSDGFVQPWPPHQPGWARAR